MLKKITILIFLSVCFAFVNDVPIKQKCIKQKSDWMKVDNVGNMYFVKGDEILKYNAKGDLIKTYSNKKYGKISSIDVSNALRILVFYKDFSQLIILDSQLSENGKSISLEELGLEQCDLSCTSFNNGIWLYNRQNMELVRLTGELKQIVNTGNLNAILESDLRPNFILENNGYLYLNNPNSGIYVFDIYGTFYKNIPLKNLKEFTVDNNCIYYTQDKKIQSFDHKLLNTLSVELSDTTASQVIAQNKLIYMHYSDSACVYK